MAYIRWLYKSWNIFWTFLGVLVLSVAIVFGATIGLMQLQPVKDQVAIVLQDRFNETFEGVVSIGSLEGFLPLQLEMKDVKIYPDADEYIPVFETSSVSASLDMWALLRNRLAVKSFEVQNPHAIIDTRSEFSVEQAFRVRTDSVNDQLATTGDPDFGFQIIIPSLKVSGGKVVVRNAFRKDNRLTSADSLQIEGLEMQMFFEYTAEQRFIDIDRVRFNIPELDMPNVELFGQVYNDDRFFELNAMTVRVGNSMTRFSGEADGVDILKGNIKQQLANASLNIMVDRLSVEPSYLAKLMPDAPLIPAALQGTLKGEGTLDSLYFSETEITIGESFVRLDGYTKNLNSPANIGYNLNLDQLMFGQGEIASLDEYLTQEQIEALSGTNISGTFSGTFDRTELDIEAEHLERGEVQLAGMLDWNSPAAIDLKFSTDSLDIGTIIDPRITVTNLTLSGELKSSSLDLKKSEGGLVIRTQQGMIDNRSFDNLSVLANWSDGYIEPNISAKINGSVITTSGWIDLRSSLPEYALEGRAGKINIKDLIQDERMRDVSADVEYELNLKGRQLNELYGQVSLDITEAIAGEDTLDRHQIYIDFNEPGAQQRIFRLTSTAFDATVQGDFLPSDLAVLGGQWIQYFSDRIREEVMFKDIEVLTDSLQVFRNQNLSITGRLKNMELITAYYPRFPVIKTTARINSTINVNSQRMLFNATLVDSKTRVNGFEADSLMLQVTGGFRNGARLKDFSGLQLQANAARVDYSYLDGQQINLSANLNQDSVDLATSVKKLADEATLDFKGGAKLTEDALTLYIQDFTLGSDAYNWKNQGEPRMQYRSDEKLVLRDFLFQSEEQYVQVNGTFSSSTEDSVNYNIGDLDLGKISQIINGRLSFGGTLNGKFTTTTLTTVPTIQGDIDVEAFSLDGTLAGDILLSSRYNPALDRFDTNISVTTDSAKYPSYYANNDRKGQKFDIDGYVLAPQDGNFPRVDSLYNFDIDFKNIDLWILPYIGPKVFTEGAGLASGKGKIWGNLDTYDFNADFLVGTEDAAYFRPQFLDTYYYAQGEISFTRDEGLNFKDIYLIDPSGGNAILSGNFDFNDFGPVNTVDLRLDMDEFQFLNSSFDPTVAFFGQAYGSSVVTITGTNLDPVIRTEQPIMVSDFSEISIPLLEETEFNEDNRFIRFVDSFDLEDIRQGGRSVNNRNSVNGIPGEPEEDLSFAERFTLDLQFTATNPMTVRLIFDPVTGDIITAEGTGRLRILLEDEQVSMFGRFDVTGGRYQFVSGDIFTRRFEIESGGTIIWEGDPANARLNVNAVYSARPDINTLSTSGTRDPENAQRVPVDLVLNIGGTISSIENNFFFRLPDTFEAQQSSTLSTQLASINRDENLKLLQATNFMLMGDFIPVSSSGQTQGNLFGENISGSAAVLNPLLSSQVINPLLSNQVNSLLNSDLSSLDVDFNLNTYNQVDLGVALRLYNDKLILRREGQITGRQSNIGDLGATYRINRTFAVTAFHRQDLTFGTISSTEQSQQAQEINGVGLEAKVSFNTWDEFFKRLFSPFRKLFGVKENEKNQEELTENR